MTAAAPLSNALTDRALRTWVAPRAAVLDEIASGSEGRLVFYAMAGSVLYTIAAVAAQALHPVPAIAERWEAWLITQVVAGVFFRPLALYAVAGLIGLLCRVAGGTGSYYDTRVAMFWTAFVAAPLGIALSVLGAGGAALFDAPLWVAHLGQTLGSVAWVLLLLPGLAAAHGFETSRPLWLGVLAVVAVLLLMAGP